MHLLFVTNNYPFEADGGEVMFIEPEIKHLVAKFDGLTIAPMKPFGRLLNLDPKVNLDLSLSEAANRSKFFLLLSFLASLFCFSDSKKWISEIWRSRRWGLKGIVKAFWWSCQAFQAERWLLNRKNCDDVLVYCYWNTSLTVGFAFASEKKKNIAVVSRVHGYDLYKERSNPPYIPFRDRVVLLLKKILPISNAGAKYLKNEYRISDEKIHVSYLGTAEPGFRCMPSDGNFLSIISCSFLVSVKRVDLIGEVLIEFARKNKQLNISWTHIGGGDSTVILKGLNSIPRNLFINFVGQFSNSEVYEYYKSNCADLFINLSESEGIPVSMMEACSVGLPIVATNVGGVSEIVRPVNGVLVSANPSVDEVVDAIQLFFSSEQRVRDGYREGAYKIWREFFSSEVNYRCFVDELCGRERGDEVSL